MSTSNNFQKPALPSPSIPDNFHKLTNPHFSTPAGMLLPRAQQPPPMFGLRGSTIPPKYLDLKKHHPYKNPVSNESKWRQGTQGGHQGYRQDWKPQNEPSNPLVYCEFCDRCFRDNDRLDRHKVEFHSEILGIKPRVYTPEEINEWKAERKKRYPTSGNILLRQQAQVERRSRGERLEAPKNRFGRKEDRNRARNNQRTSDGNQFKDNRNNNKRGRNNQRSSATVGKEITKDSDPPVTSVEEIVELNGLPMFRGTLNLPDYHSNSSVIKTPNALSLLGDYGSATDTENEPDEEVEPMSLETGGDNEPPLELPIEKCDPCPDEPMLQPHEVPKSNPHKPRRRRRGKQSTENNDSEVQGELGTTQTVVDTVEIASNDQQSQPVVKAGPSNKPTTRKSGLQDRTRRYQNTLLEKLLEPDIRHERNVLLQCVRFVVQNNFFNVGQKKSE